MKAISRPRSRRTVAAISRSWAELVKWGLSAASIYLGRRARQADIAVWPAAGLQIGAGRRPPAPGADSYRVATAMAAPAMIAPVPRCTQRTDSGRDRCLRARLAKKTYAKHTGGNTQHMTAAMEKKRPAES